MRKAKRVLDEAGQATVEFALTMILLMSVVMFYLQLSLVMAWGNYVHYATFMAARAYLSGSDSKDDQRQRARDTIVLMLKKSSGQAGVDRFPSIAKGTGGDGDVGGLAFDLPQFNATDPDFSWGQGVRYTFKARLFMIPLGGNKGSKGAVNSVTLTSESYLGRDPSYSDCQNEMNSKGADGKGAIFDNGC